MKIVFCSTRRSGFRRRAFTLIEVLTVVVIIGLLATIAVSNFVIARDNARLNAIRRNLRTLETAKEEWAMEKNKPQGTDIADVGLLAEYLHGGRIVDVVNETYLPNPVGKSPEAELPGNVGLGPYAPGSLIPAP